VQAEKHVCTTTVAAVHLQRVPSCIPAANVPAMKVTPEMDTHAHVSIH